MDEVITDQVSKPFSPVFKRFLKGIIACVLAFAIKFALDNIGLMVSNDWVPLITGLLLALEKAIPKNF